MNTLPDRIDFLLSETHWSPAELARQAGVSRAAVTDWRNGKVRRLTADVAARIAAACNVDAMWVATGAGVARPSGSATQAPIQATSPEWPFRTIDPARYQLLPDALRGMIEGRALALIEEWEASTRFTSGKPGSR